MERVRKLDHVAIAVRSLEDAVDLFHGLLGGRFIGGGDNPLLRVRAVQLEFPPGFRIELLKPLDEGSYLYRYLEAHGEGIHHLTGYVEDVEAAATHVEESGYETVDTSTAEDSWHETFIRPTTAFGVLVQLARPAVPWDEPFGEFELEDVLAGKVGVLHNVVWLRDTGRQLTPGPGEVPEEVQTTTSVRCSDRHEMPDGHA